MINTWKGVEEVAKFTLYLEDELNEEAKKMAKKHLLNKNNYIVRAVEEKIERDKKKFGKEGSKK